MKVNRILGSMLAVAMVLGFAQCAQNNTPAPTAVPVASGELKIAYVEIDTLLANYDFYQDISEEMLRKEENSRLLLAEEASKFQKEAEEFQKKLQNNVFSSQERAQQEQNRLLKKQQELQELNDRLSNELALESDNNSLKISDSIQSFLKEYNKTAGYSMILSKVGDNILLVDPAMNITNEVVAGLNARYAASK